MSTGQWIGAILGAIVGFIIGGWYGAIYGAIIGYSLGGIVDPVKPDVKQPGAPAPQGLQIMTNVIGNPIFDVLGTAKITGQLLFFGKEFNRPIWYRPAKGVRAISGYKYYASWALGICMGPADCLYTVFRDQDPIWEGELTRPESGGEATIQIEGGGTMVFYFGTDDQMPNVNAGTLLPDPTLNTGYRHLCWAFFDAFFMNEYNRMPSMSFVVKKIPPMFDEPTSQIQTYDINPAHALWHTLIEKAGLPVEWVDPVDFLAVATELFGEGRGISILFDVHQATLNYLEAINSHVDCILRYGSDGKFHPKLIRYVDPTDLPIINESKLLEEPTFSRRSWIDTINEVKVQYSEILGERPSPYTHVYGVQGYPSSSPWAGQTKLVKRNMSDLSFVSEVNLGDYSQSGIANRPGIKYVPSEDTLIVLSHDISLGGADPDWRIQKRKASDLSSIYSFIYDPGLPTNYSGRTWSHILLSDDGVSFYCWMTDDSSLSQVFQKRNISDGSLVWSRVFGTFPGYHGYKDVCLYGGNIYAIGKDYYNRLYLCKFTEGNVDVWAWRDTVNMDYYYGAGIYVDAGGIYVGYYKGTTDYWTVQKWTDKSIPTLVWTQSPGANRIPYKIIDDGTGANIIIVGGSGAALYEKRAKADGTLICTGGWQVGNTNCALDLTPVYDGIFYVGGDDFGGSTGSYRARYEKVRSSDLVTEAFVVDIDRPVTSGITIGL